MLLSNAIALFERDCKLRGLKSKTITGYHEGLETFLRSTDILSTEEITVPLVEEYILRLYDRPISKATVNTYLRHLRVFFHFLEREKILNPDDEISGAIRVPKMPIRKVDILTDEQIRQLFGSVDTDDILSVRDAMILALLLDSGLRRNEVLTMRYEDINLSKNTVKVYGKGDKERLVPLGKFTRKLMKRYINLSEKLRSTAPDGEYLVMDRRGHQMSENAFKLMIQRKKKEVGFDFCAHKLRHNFATHYCLDEYEQCGFMDIYKLKTILGHSDIHTTMIYMHLAQEIIAATTSISHLDKIDLQL